MTNAMVDDCKTAELHRILAVQSHGALIAIDRASGRVSACSRNIEKFLGIPADELNGADADAALDPAILADCSRNSDAVHGEVTIRDGVVVGGSPFSVASHCTAAHCIVELEPGDARGSGLSFAARRKYVGRLERARSADDCAKALMQEVARLTGFDRVMLYRFMPDWHGEVIAEVVRPGIQGFLGLRFPAGDIPANARRLYTVNFERSVADVEAESVPILCTEDAGALDLSWARLRAVHPVHLTYLGNIGARASFSVSIVLDGTLWGMIACHHLTPRSLPVSERQACEELMRLTAMQMGSVDRINAERAWNQYRGTIAEIRGHLRANMAGFPAVEAQIAAIQRLFSASGIWQYFNGRDHVRGEVPDVDLREQLKAWVSEQGSATIAAFDQIPKRFADIPAMVRHASGMLLIPVTDDDFMLLFRSEEVEEVLWAGQPASPDAPIAASDDLTPRTSFLQWAQSVRGRATPWTPMDIESAGLLLQELVEYLRRCEVEHQALADTLTGLANRLLFEQELKHTVDEIGQVGGAFAVLMIDLDKFKPVNDSLGHAAGDELLIQVAKRLAAIVRAEDLVARLGGDEFAAILRDVDSTANVEEIVGRMVEEIARPFKVFSSSVEIGVSIGICHWSANDPLPLADLLDRADVALYAAKQAGRSRFEMFVPAMLEARTGGEEIHSALLAGLGNDEFELRFQPIVRTGDRGLAGFEAYCYWRHPTRGELGAAEFVHLMAHHKLMTQWTRWCIRRLFEHHAARLRAGTPPVPLSLNISAAQFIRLDLVGLCAEAAGDFGMGPEWLCFELDERALGPGSDRAVEKVAQLARRGVRVNLDHFGSGAIALRQLPELAFGALKFSALELRLDPDADRSNGRLALMQSIARALDVPMVATQVETQQAVDWAVAHGIDYVQGYAIDRPLNAEPAIERR